MNPNNTIEFNEEDNYLHAIIKLVLRAVKRIPPKRVFNLFSTVIANHDVYESEYDNIIEFILDCVIEQYKSEGVKKEDLFGVERGAPTEARKLCIIIIKEHLDIDPKLISNFFGRQTYQTVYMTISEWKNLDKTNKKNPQIRDFIDRHAKVTEKVLPKILAIKLSQNNKPDNEEKPETAVNPENNDQGVLYKIVKKNP